MRIKPLTQVIVIVSSVLLFVCDVFASFNTNIYCRVRGYVYYDGYEVSSLDREDLCAMISERVEGDKIVLWNDLHWVLIRIPNDIKGFTTFWYKWGADNAYINGKLVHVDWGFVLKG